MNGYRDNAYVPPEKRTMPELMRKSRRMMLLAAGFDSLASVLLILHHQVVNGAILALAAAGLLYGRHLQGRWWRRQ